VADITLLEARSRFIGVIQSGVIKAGRLAAQVSNSSAFSASNGQPDGSRHIELEVAEQVTAEHHVGEVPARSDVCRRQMKTLGSRTGVVKLPESQQGYGGQDDKG